ncbi:MAG: hypothetical protein ACRDPC_14495 [Solirubrobacteraceae bacterium]
MGEGALERRSLSRRGFIGAAAGSAAAAGAATIGLRTRAFADSDPSAHDAAIPKWRIGIQCYVVRGAPAMGNGGASESNPDKTRQWLDTIVGTYGNVAVETYGNNYGQLTQSRWRQEVEARGGYCWGDHAGGNLGSGGAGGLPYPPALTPNVDSLNTALSRMHNLGTFEIGNAGTGTVGFTGNGANFNVDMALDCANRMNHWGQWLQKPEAIAGVTQPGIEGARYYHHPHQNEWRRVRGDGDPDGPPTYSGQPEWINRQLMEVVFEHLDPEFGFVQMDLAWARHDVALNTDQLYLDIHSEYEDQIESYHVKGMSGTAEVDCNLPEGSVNYRTGEPISGNAGDRVPWVDLFNSMRWPERKTYNWERDGPGSGLNLADLQVSFDRFATLMHQSVLDRSLVGAPANVTPPRIDYNARARLAKVKGNERGEWVRQQGNQANFQWLRNGTQPIWGATGPAYKVQPADAGWDLVCEVSAISKNGNTTQEPTAPVTIAGSSPQNITPPSL